MAATKEKIEALKLAIGHIEHMAAWIGKQNAGYSFEALGEDMPTIKDALRLLAASVEAEPVAWLSPCPHPSTWTYDPQGQMIWGASVKGGVTRVLDVRNWGYLTGKGHGALGMDPKIAAAAQDGLGEFIVGACKAAVTPSPDYAKGKRDGLEAAAKAVDGARSQYLTGGSIEGLLLRVAAAVRALKEGE